MSSVLHWFDMNGYGTYIWSAYAVVCIVLIGNLVAIKRSQTKLRKTLLQWYGKSS